MRHRSSDGFPQERHARLGKVASLLAEEMVGSEGCARKEQVPYCPYSPSRGAETGTFGEMRA
jgi:hypothetical protein